MWGVMQESEEEELGGAWRRAKCINVLMYDDGKVAKLGVESTLLTPKMLRWETVPMSTNVL